MQLIADTHTHTLASQHAFSTILENAAAAAEAGMAYLGWTDHAPDMVDGAHPWHFGNLYAVPDTLHGVRILKGIEADLVGFHGELDQTQEQLRKFEWVVVSIHSPMLKAGTVEQHTTGYMEAAKNPYVDVIAHSGSIGYPYDYEEAVKVFRDYGKLVEINEHSYEARKDSIPNCVALAKLCKKYDCRIVINSDAHFATQIGHFDQALHMLREIEFPEELVVNASTMQMELYLAERKARLSMLSGE